jgi:hypothetical protein
VHELRDTIVRQSGEERVYAHQVAMTADPGWEVRTSPAALGLSRPAEGVGQQACRALYSSTAASSAVWRA